jgi:hypothetical protein
MYTHVTTRVRILHRQDTFRSYTEMYAEDLGAAILRLVVQELFIAAVSTVVS